jgi:phosphate-selective porin OprO and OprP
MRTSLMIGLVSVLSGGVGYCQAPTPADSPSAQAVSALPADRYLPSAAPDTVEALRAEMARLQKRLDEIAPPANVKPAVDAPAPGVPLLDTSTPASNRTFPTILGFCEHGTSAPAKLEDDPGIKMNATWRDGLEFQSLDNMFRVHVGGFLAFDYGWNAASHAVQFGPGGTGELADGADFRYARIRIDGTAYEHVEWVAEFDFSNSVNNDTSTSTAPIGSPSFSNVWVGYNDIPYIGTLRAGWQDEPISLQHPQSAKYLSFMERAPGYGTLSLTSPGIVLLNFSADERLTWAFGLFHAQNDSFGFGFGDGEYAETGRVTWLPWYRDEGRELLHLGIGATHRHLNDNEVDLKARPSVHTMPQVDEPPLANTGTIGGTTLDAVDVELAGVCGPWTLRSEYAAIFVHDALFPDEPPPQGIPKGTLFYQGTYVELLYFLTGESDQYNRREGVFTRVIPRRNFNFWGGEPGCGAWQVGIRYGYLDLQNKDVNGATLNDLTLGLNWFLNPNAKLQWNLAIDHRDSTPPGSSGWTYIFGGRVAIDF